MPLLCRLSEVAVVGNVSIDDVDHQGDEKVLEAAHAAQLRGPATLLKFLDHISLQSAQVSTRVSSS